MLATGEIPVGDTRLFAEHCKQANVRHDSLENSLGNYCAITLYPDKGRCFSLNALCIIARFNLKLVEGADDWDRWRSMD